MELVKELLSNRMLTTPIMAWAIAQVIKTIVFFAMNGKLDLTRLTGDGGMPSAHSATVTSLAVRTCIDCGASSAQFAIATIVAVVVMHDAVGVRRESGKHAKALNELIDFLDPQITLDVKLKEFIGHTPSQVAAGALLGFSVAIATTLI